MFKHALLSLAFVFASSAALADQPKPSSTKPADAAKPAANVTAPGTAPKVLMHTSMGDITMELYPDKAPKTVDNFEQYVKEGFYNGTVFHRVINNFMIQGGGWTKDLQRKRTRAPIHNEANNGLSNLKYTVAMARTSDPHSAAAEFFINIVDNKRLDYTADTNGLTWGYTVFGKVTAGQDVVEKIKAVQTGPSGPLPSDVPLTPVVIDKMEMVQ